nr:hypothetical protein [Tanacetum cinerariifolium]
MGGRPGYEIQSSFVSITSNDQDFTVDRNMDDFLVTKNFGMILGQPVHTDDNIKTIEFNRMPPKRNSASATSASKAPAMTQAAISNCNEDCKVKFATGTLTKESLS